MVWRQGHFLASRTEKLRQQLNTLAEQFTARYKRSSPQRWHLASVVFQLQAQKSTKTRWAMPAPAAVTKDPLALPLTNQWRPCPWKGTPGALMTLLLKPCPETHPKVPACKREIKASEQRNLRSPSGERPPSFFTGSCVLNQQGCPTLWCLLATH